MTSGFRRAIVISVLCSVAACTSAGATKRGIVTFNQVFADARNEILLRNVLRAREGEPLQFSTVSNVTGAMRPQFTVAGELENLAAKVKEILKPSGNVALRNPQVAISPLETKEFREGMQKPVEPEFVERLVRSGWDPDVVLNLVVDDVPCEKSFDRARFIEEARWERFGRSPQRRFRELTLPAAEAAKLAREGAGEGMAVRLVDPEPQDPPGSLRVSFDASAEPEKILVSTKGSLCGANAIAADKIRYRSPLQMINYLGREGFGPNEYLWVVSPRGRIPNNALVGTSYLNRLYYVPRIAEAERERYRTAGAKSAQTLAVLAEIIGFQTTNAQLSAGKPTITVPSD